MRHGTYQPFSSATADPTLSAASSWHRPWPGQCPGVRAQVKIHSRFDTVPRQHYSPFNLASASALSPPSVEPADRVESVKSSSSQVWTALDCPGLRWTGLDWTGRVRALTLAWSFPQSPPEYAHQLGQGRRGLAMWCARELMLLWQPLTHRQRTGYASTHQGRQRLDAVGRRRRRLTLHHPSCRRRRHRPCRLRVKSSQVESSRVKSSQVESSRVESSRVKSSQIKSSLLGPSTRVGGQRRWCGWATA